MPNTVKAIRGMPDILPKEIPLWHEFEKQWRNLAAGYGYEEIRFPVLEVTALFKRSIGEVTDIIEKEMFSFQSRDGESLSLRPEGTAGCVRAAIEHGLLYHQVQRFWYTGPMFRYERPQKGRYRQFYQTGVEAFGLAGPDIDVEQILMTQRFWRNMQVESALSLQINSLGSFEVRKQYREKLVEYLSKYYQDLDEDSQRRLKTNPLRILDSKNPALTDILFNAPKCLDYLDSASQAHFTELRQRLTDLNIPYQINSKLVRGLDYYNRTVYEWVTDKLGAQGTVCAGGRYDRLVGQLGGEETPAVGFSIGIERVLLLQQALGISQESTVDAYVVHEAMAQDLKAIWLFLEAVRNQRPNIRLIMHCGGGNFKHQFKKADNSGAKMALILGRAELSSGTVGVKFLREEREQISVSREKFHQFLTEYLGTET